MNLQQFLEEELKELRPHIEDIELVRFYSNRLINKVLDEVKKEVEKHYEYDTSIYDGAPFRVENETSRVLDDILDQLKLK